AADKERDEQGDPRAFHGRNLLRPRILARRSDSAAAAPRAEGRPGAGGEAWGRLPRIQAEDLVLKTSSAYLKRVLRGEVRSAASQGRHWNSYPRRLTLVCAFHRLGCGHSNADGRRADGGARHGVSGERTISAPRRRTLRVWPARRQQSRLRRGMDL